jgi:hypothetical protein
MSYPARNISWSSNTVLVRLEHSGWYIKDKVSLLLHTNEYFYWKHQTHYKFCNSRDKWLMEIFSEVRQLLDECHAAGRQCK